MSNIYIIRRLHGLSKLKGVSPIQSHFANKEYNQGGVSEHSEFYKGNHLPGSKHSLSMSFDDLQGKTCWSGTEEKLNELVKKIGLKYEKDHVDSGKVITSSSVYDMDDPFFNHSYFFNKFVAIDGEILLNTEIPEQELLLLSIKDNRTYVDRSSSKGFTSSAVWEIISPEHEEQSKAEDNDKFLKAINLLTDKKEDSLKSIAFILGTQGDLSDPKIVKNNLVEGIKKNKKVKEFNIDYIDKFTELCLLPKDDLIPLYNIKKGISHGVLSYNGNYYQFKSSNSAAETAINVRTFTELVSFFNKNTNQFTILVDENKIREREGDN